MVITKKEIICFLGELIKLIDKQNKEKINLIKEKFNHDFGKGYSYKMEIERPASDLSSHYITVTRHSEYSSENTERTIVIHCKVYDLTSPNKFSASILIGINSKWGLLVSVGVHSPTERLNEVKDEIIVLLGTALVGKTRNIMERITANNNIENTI